MKFETPCILTNYLKIQPKRISTKLVFYNFLQKSQIWKLKRWSKLRKKNI